MLELPYLRLTRMKLEDMFLCHEGRRGGVEDRDVLLSHPVVFSLHEERMLTGVTLLLPTFYTLLP